MLRGPESASLRKACRNCTLAKRRCVIRVPYCERCSKRGLACRYDLEPLAVAATKVHTPERTLFADPGNLAVHCLLNRKSSAIRNDSHHLCTFMSDVREGIEVVRSTLCQIPSSVARQRPSVFIHPKVRHPKECDYLDTARHDIMTTTGIHPSHANFQALVNCDSSDGSLETVLQEVQAIMLYLLAFTFGSTMEAQKAALPYIDYMSGRISRLESLASTFTARGLTPWQAWLFAESTRRTILTSHILTCVFFRHRYEVSEVKLRMEALPFDDRGGLWLAETPQGWAAAAGAKRGSEVKTNLVSWHEFGCKSPDICMDSAGDLFLSMMLVAHNGMRCVERRSNVT